jgi:hypothetical protein
MNRLDFSELVAALNGCLELLQVIVIVHKLVELGIRREDR